MANKVKNTGLAAVLLKSGQQIAGDLAKTLPKESTQGFLSYSAEHLLRIGAAGTAGYAIDEAISYAEEFIPNKAKALRGLTPLALSTVGVAAAMHFAGDYLGAQEFEGLGEAIKHVATNYQNSLSSLISWNPTEVDAGYLTGAVVALKSGARCLKNIGKSIAEYAEKNRTKEQTSETKSK